MDINTDTHTYNKIIKQHIIYVFIMNFVRIGGGDKEYLSSAFCITTTTSNPRQKKPMLTILYIIVLLYPYSHIYLYL